MNGSEILRTDEVKNNATAESWIPTSYEKGKAFDGWYSDKEAKTLFDFKTKIIEDTIIYAKWKDKLYTVFYNTTGAYPIDSKINVKWLDTDLLPTPNPSKTGYSFVCWIYGDYNDIVGKEMSYSTLVNNDDEILSVTINASWDQHNYIIQFDSDGGSAVLDDNTVTVKDLNYIPKAPTKKGSTFSHWECEGKEVDGTKKFEQLVNEKNDKDEGVFIFKAIWIERNYQVNYNTVIEDVDIESKKNVKWNEKNLLPDMSLNKKGYTFKGWKAGDKEVDIDTAFKDISATDIDGSEVTLIAEWKKNEYTIEYEGVSKPIADRTKVTIDDTDYIPIPPEKLGSSFVGWKFNDNHVVGNKPFGELIDNEKDGKIFTFTAVWKDRDYQVNYDTIIDGLTFPSKTNVKWTDANLLPNEPSSKGYTFIGWYAGSTPVTKETTFDKIAASDDIGTEANLIAKWKTHEYRIEYKNVEEPIDNKENITVEETDYLPTPPKKKGYNFKGWEVNKKPVEENKAFKDVITDEADGATITFNAVWEARNYQVNYDTGIMELKINSEENVKWEEKDLLPKNSFIKGYTLIYWKFNDSVISKDDAFRDLSTNDTEGTAITFNGEWKINEYTIRYESGSDPIEDKKKVTVKDTDYLPTSPIKEGYTFDGWKVGSKVVNGSKPFGDVITDEADGSIITFVGMWKEIDPIEPNVPITPEKPISPDGSGNNESTKPDVSSNGGGITNSGNDNQGTRSRISTKENQKFDTVVKEEKNGKELKGTSNNRTVNDDSSKGFMDKVQGNMHLGILIVLFGYVIYASVSLYRAKKKEEVSKKVDLTRFVVTAVMFAGVLIEYLLSTSRLSLQFSIMSVVVMVGFIIAFYRQNRKLNSKEVSN